MQQFKRKSLYLAVSQDSDDGDPQRFDVLLDSRTHGCSQLLQNAQSLLHLNATYKDHLYCMAITVIAFRASFRKEKKNLNRIWFSMSKYYSH